jgi:hypothetical protein
MRPLALLPLVFLLLSGCKRETSEAVAEAKGAAADARRAAEDARRAADEAAAKAKAEAQAAADQARAAAADATARVHEMGQSVQQGVNDATAQAKAGVEHAGQSIREVGEGNVVTGRLTVSSPKQIVVVAPPGGSAVSLGADDQTRWVAKGGIGAREGIPLSSSVRVTYIVRDGRRVATLVEQLAP